MTLIHIVAIVSILLLIALTTVSLVRITKLPQPTTTDTGKRLMYLIAGEWHVCDCGVLVRNNLTDEHIRLSHHTVRQENE